MNSGPLKLNLIIIVLAICFILATSKPINAQEAGYSHICYQTSSTTLPTINGQWGSEWTYGLQTTFGTNANFTDEWYLAASSPSVVFTITSSLKLWIIQMRQGILFKYFLTVV